MNGTMTGQIAWEELQDHGHAGLQRLVGDLNRLYRGERALQHDADPSGFRWIVGDDAAQSVFAYERKCPGAKPIVAVVNMTPVPRRDYRLGVPLAGPLARTHQHRLERLWRLKSWQWNLGGQPASPRTWLRTISIACAAAARHPYPATRIDASHE